MRSPDPSTSAPSWVSLTKPSAWADTPFEVVKIRMQQRPGAGSMWGTAARLAAEEGPLALYTGLEAYALRQIVWNGGFFGLLGLGNAVLPPTAGGSKAVRDFLLGLAAGSTATVLNNPLDVAKSRIQAAAEPGSGSGSGSRWSVGVTIQILREEGLRGVCKGLPARLYRSAPGHGLLYCAFETISAMIR